MKTRFLSSLLIIGLCACTTDEVTYDDTITSGWTAMSDQNFEAAFDHFSDAIDMDPDQAAGYAGLAWSLMYLDFLDQAAGTFIDGSTKTNPTADLYAGWAFTLSAKKSYSNSNTEITQALTLDANWSLFGQSQLGLSVTDLHVCKAENHFLLGEFSQSLSEVKILNPSFAMTSVTTDSDKANLAKEIQRLKGLSKAVHRR